MYPPARKTRSTNNPGVVDLPKPRRSPADVASDKAEAKKIAVANTKKMRERAAQVARLENEIRTAQKEASYASGSQKRRVKRTFSREDIVEDSEAAGTEHAPTTSQGSSTELKRKAGERSESFDNDDIRPTKVAREMSDNKPRGLADARARSPLVTTVIEDFEYDRNQIESDDEDLEDDLEYPGDVPESLVTIKSTVAVNVSSKDAKNHRRKVHALPSGVRRTFSEMFVPVALEEVGCSATPWVNLNVSSLQGCVDTVYPGIDYTVRKGDPLESSANSRVMAFRNMIGTVALINVKSFLDKFKDPERVAEYVKSGLLYHGEIPFLYRVFEPSAVPSSKEKGGYKVTRSGPFQNQPIVNTMLSYYGKRGIKEYIPTDAPSPAGKNPIGALALISTAVERAFLMHSTGHFIKDDRPFSEKFWGHRTAIYVKLAKGLSSSKWDGFNGALASAQGLQDKLRECSQPVERWTDNPDEYFIIASDPAEPAE